MFLTTAFLDLLGFLYVPDESTLFAHQTAAVGFIEGRVGHIHTFSISATLRCILIAENLRNVHNNFVLKHQVLLKLH
jgi:hypothetical protein